MSKTYRTNETIDNPIYSNIVINGNVVITPELQDKNILNHIIRKCKEKYNNKVIEIEGELNVICSVTSINTTTLTNKVLRNNNECSTMYFVQMYCSVFKAMLTQNLVCKVININNEFIEAHITLSGTPVIFLIMLDETNVNTSLFTISNDNIRHIPTNNVIQPNDLLIISVESINQNMTNIIIFGRLLDIA